MGKVPTGRPTGRPPTPAPIRFFAFVKKTNNCWLWLGSVLQNGLPYGQFRDGKKMWKAHRWSYQYHKGSIPENKLICHSCDNPKCVNPAHLWVGEHWQNAQDMVRKGRVNPCFGKRNFFYGKNPNHYRKPK